MGTTDNDTMDGDRQAGRSHLGEEDLTSRNFQVIRFKDSYNAPCSIQESSRVPWENDDGTVDDPLGWIWLGIDSPVPEMSRMHLNEEQVRGLIERLQGWLDTGTLFPTADEL
jgi:hypothetical protein